MYFLHLVIGVPETPKLLIIPPASAWLTQSFVRLTVSHVTTTRTCPYNRTPTWRCPNDDLSFFAKYETFLPFLASLYLTDVSTSLVHSRTRYCIYNHIRAVSTGDISGVASQSEVSYVSRHDNLFI